MRDSFVQTLHRLAGEDPNLMLVVADLGFKIFDEFRGDYPRQFLNVGVAEQNLMGVATGMALEGHKVFAYSIGNFPTLRALEQIRNDICYHELPVTVVTAGAGLCYGPLGASHHATEDMGCLRSLPNLTILAPGDPWEGAWATEAAYALGRPCYLRLGRAGEPAVHPQGAKLELGRLAELLPAGEVAVLSTGGILQEAAHAAEMLRAEGITAGLYSVPTLKPLDDSTVAGLARSCRLLVTVEEHAAMGGLGSAVAEVVAGLSVRRARVLRLGLAGDFVRFVGDQAYLRRQVGLDAESLTRRVAEALAVRDQD